MRKPSSLNDAWPAPKRKGEMMKTWEVNFWFWIVRRLPKKLLYFAVQHVWAMATVQKYTDKHPDEVTWSMALKFLEKKR